MKDKTPLIRLVRRDAMKRTHMWAIRVVAFAVALLLGSLIIMAIGKNPLEFYANIIDGSLGSKTALKQTVKIAVPLLGCAIAIAPCFKMRFWNIGAEGQITAGAIATAYFALFYADKFPSPVLLCVMALSAMIFGGIWGIIPAFFKAKFGTNETLFTLMMNYIIIGVVKYLQGGPWEAPPRGSQIIAQFEKSACLPKVFGVHCGWIIVLILMVFMFFYMRYTKHGYEISVVGESLNTARYAGMNVPYIIMRTVFLSGAIAGLVGFMISSGASNTLSFGVANGVGFTAITVAWLSGLNPFAMLGISGFLAMLTKGAGAVQSRMDVPASISDIITGIILFCMLGCEFFINYRIIFRKSHGEDAEK